jgi:hypothetical protein
MTAFGRNLTGLPVEDPRAQEALSRAWRAPRALALRDGTFALYTFDGNLLAVGLSAPVLAEQIALYVAVEQPRPMRLTLRNAPPVRKFSEKGEPEIDLVELGLV